MAVVGISSVIAAFAVIGGTAQLVMAGLNIVMAANPIGLVVVTVAALTGAVAAAIYYCDDLKAAFLDSAFGRIMMWFWDFGKTILKVAGMVFLFTTPLGWVVTAIGTVVYNWEALKAAFLASEWGQTIIGLCSALGGKFRELGSWMSSIIPSYDGVKASFMDNSWVQAVLGWINKITNKFSFLIEKWDKVKGYLNWIPGIDVKNVADDIPKTSPSLEAPRSTAIPPGGASKSIANAVTDNSSQTESRTVNVGQVVTSRPINSQEIGNQLWMGA